MQPNPKKPSSPPSGAQRELLSELLVLGAQAGSSQAFGQLVSLWQEPLWRYAYRLCGREDAAWDILQESWVAITAGLAKLKDPAYFKRWSYTILTRAATNRLRRMPEEEIRAPADMQLHPEACNTTDQREEALVQLRRALGKLKRADRALVSLRYLENFELWELAGILGIPEGTVKSRLHRIRKQLKHHLENMNHE